MWNLLIAATVAVSRAIFSSRQRAEASRKTSELELRRQAIIERLSSIHDLSTKTGLEEADSELSAIATEFVSAPATISIQMIAGEEPKTLSRGSQYVGLAFALQAHVGDKSVPPETFTTEIMASFQAQKRPKGMNTVAIQSGHASVWVNSTEVSGLTQARSILQRALRLASDDVCTDLAEKCNSQNAEVHAQIDAVRQQLYAIHNAKLIAASPTARPIPAPISFAQREQKRKFREEQLRQAKSSITASVILLGAIALLVFLAGAVASIPDHLATSIDMTRAFEGRQQGTKENWKEGWTEGKLTSYEVSCINAAHSAQVESGLVTNNRQRNVSAAFIVRWCSCMAELIANNFHYDEMMKNELAYIENLEAMGKTKDCHDVAAAEAQLKQE